MFSWMRPWIVKPFISERTRPRHPHAHHEDAPPDAASNPELDFGPPADFLQVARKESHGVAKRAVSGTFYLALLIFIGPMVAFVLYFIVTGVLDLVQDGWR